MFKAFVLSAFAAAAVNAASWPMITVNSNGDIVLNAPTRANSIQFTATAVTASPTGATAGTRTTVTDLASTTNVDSDVFDLTVPSGLATSGGIKLPTPTTGRTITIFNSASSAAAYELWSSSTSVFIDGTSATQVSIDASAVWVQAIAVSTSRWVLQTSAATATGAKGFVSANTLAATASATTGTLTAAQMLNGRLTVPVSGAAITYTTAQASALTAADANSNDGDAYTFTVVNSATQVTGTDLSLILAAGTGVTVPADGTQLVVPGQTRVYSLYRTSSTAWTLVQQSSFVIYPTTTLTISTAFTSSLSQSRTIHATRFTATPVTAGASEAFAVLFVNNYFGIRDLAFGAVSPGTSLAAIATAASSTQRASAPSCGARAEKTIACQGQLYAAAAGNPIVFTIVKA